MIYETGSTVYNFMVVAVTHMYPGIIVMVAILSMALLAIGVA